MISVIVPVYNIEKYIEHCILSILNQTYSDFELLLINDGSTDSSYEICKKWEDSDTRIKVISKPNGGVSSARNLGLDIASGEYLFFIDGDDRLTPDCFEKLMQHMTPDVDFVSAEYQEVADEGFSVPINASEHKNFEGILTQKEIIHDCYNFKFYTKVVWAKLFRKELWDDVRFNHMLYSEDTYAMFQVIENVRNAAFILDPLYLYLQRSSGASRYLKLSAHANYLETLLFMYQKALKKYPEHKESFADFYNGYAYYILKAYQARHKRKEGLTLIENMQFVYKTSETKNPSFSQKILVLPKGLIYLLISIKNKFPSDDPEIID